MGLGDVYKRQLMMDQQNLEVEIPNIDENKPSEEFEESTVEPDEENKELNEELMDNTICKESDEVIIQRDEDDESDEELMDNIRDEEYEEAVVDDDEEDIVELNEELMEYTNRKIMVFLKKRSYILQLDYIKLYKQLDNLSLIHI